MNILGDIGKMPNFHGKLLIIKDDRVKTKKSAQEEIKFQINC